MTDNGTNEHQSSEQNLIVHSEELLKGKREIIIRHGNENYRLRLTKAGKLILNK